jgi:hypothetical protein
MPTMAIGSVTRFVYFGGKGVMPFSHAHCHSLLKIRVDEYYIARRAGCNAGSQCQDQGDDRRTAAVEKPHRVTSLD